MTTSAFGKDEIVRIIFFQFVLQVVLVGPLSAHPLIAARTWMLVRKISGFDASRNMVKHAETLPSLTSDQKVTGSSPVGRAIKYSFEEVYPLATQTPIAHGVADFRPAACAAFFHQPSQRHRRMRR